MSNATIYINQENQEAWDKIGNKSKWVNDRLAKQQDLKAELMVPAPFNAEYPLQVNPKSHTYMPAKATPVEELTDFIPEHPHKTFPRNKKKL